MSLLQQAANAIATAAGWRNAFPGGVVRFSLKDGLVMTLSTPDGKTALFQGEVRILPASEADASHLLQKAAHLAVAGMKKHPCILSLSGNTLMLHTTMRLDAPSTHFPETAKIFLNDMAWWRARLTEGGVRETATTSPFSMAGFGNGRI